MSVSVVFLSYLAALLVAVYLLWRFSHVRWFWHLFAVAAALAIGLMPPIPQSYGATYDIVIGSAFLFLLMWGAGEPLYRVMHLPRHR
jgi:uncharacterized membrane protein YphA (DoxX/SURF4 family)